MTKSTSFGTKADDIIVIKFRACIGQAFDP